jgi:regulator of sirC expression with transglutaminase-like and TPR domain
MLYSRQTSSSFPLLRHAAGSAEFRGSRMYAGRTYDQDVEFQKLLARNADVDLAVAALEMARDAYPQLDFHPTLEWIRQRGKELAGPVARAKSEREALAELSRCIAETHGIVGDKQAYETAEGSYLHRVIETRRGIPISLSLLYMAVGKEVGLELSGASAPMHFLARYESVDGPLFVDAFSRGRVLTLDECLAWIREISGLDPPRIKRALRPASARSIVVRMLNNLKAIYAKHDQWREAWLVQHRLSSLQPAVYDERRDLALISLKAHRTAQAVDLLESCLRACPAEEKTTLEAHLEEAQRQLARWN